MEDFATFIRQEGWDYNPDASKSQLLLQYRDKAERLNAASLMTTDLVEAAEISRVAADYLLLAEIVQAEAVTET